MPSGNRWRPRDAGRVVRPYAVTGGRTEPGDGGTLDLLALVLASRQPAESGVNLTPEHRRILRLCREQATVADIAADTTLPVGVVRVLLGDLIKDGAVTVVRRRAAGEQAGTEVLQEILNGLRAL
jgi:hypothetical protein